MYRFSILLTLFSSCNLLHKDYDNGEQQCSDVTSWELKAMKYITNFKKIVLLAIAKEIITADPFNCFKAKKNQSF